MNNKHLVLTAMPPEGVVASEIFTAIGIDLQFMKGTKGDKFVLFKWSSNDSEPLPAELFLRLFRQDKPLRVGIGEICGVIHDA